MSNSEYVDPNDEIPIDLKRLIKKDEIKPVQKVIEDTLAINLGAEKDPQEVQIDSTLSQSESNTLTALLKEYKDVFTWSY